MNRAEIFAKTFIHSTASLMGPVQRSVLVDRLERLKSGRSQWNHYIDEMLANGQLVKSGYLISCGKVP